MGRYAAVGQHRERKAVRDPQWQLALLRRRRPVWPLGSILVRGQPGPPVGGSGDRAMALDRPPEAVPAAHPQCRQFAVFDRRRGWHASGRDARWTDAARRWKSRTGSSAFQHPASSVAGPRWRFVDRNPHGIAASAPGAHRPLCAIQWTLLGFSLRNLRGSRGRYLGLHARGARSVSSARGTDVFRGAGSVA